MSLCARSLNRLHPSSRSGKIPAEAVPLLSSEDMASDARREENAKIREEALFQAERGKTTAASTNMFKCARCKKNQCTYFQMQTRSADEPMTTFVTYVAPHARACAPAPLPCAAL